MEPNDILDSELTYEDDKLEVDFVDQNKFILLSFISLGLYGIWWMYKSWRFFKEKDSLDIMPAARTIFAILFLYSLFERIKVYARSNGEASEYSSAGLFVMFLVLNFLSRLPDPYWLISIGAFVCLLQPVRTLNNAIERSDFYTLKKNSGFNGRQIIILIVGGIFWVLVLIGLFMSEN